MNAENFNFSIESEDVTIYTSQPTFESLFIFTAVLILIFTLAITFNSISITSILAAKAYTPINILIINLGFADLTYSLGIPFFVTQILNYRQSLGLYGCRMFLFTEFNGVIVGIFTVAALSVERFLDVTDKKKILDSFSNKFKLLVIILYCVTIWLFSFALTFPLIFSIKKIKNVCQSEWTDSTIRLFFISKLIVIFIVPYFIIIVSSLKLLLFLNRWKRKFNGSSQKKVVFGEGKRHALRLKNRPVMFKSVVDESKLKLSKSLPAMNLSLEMGLKDFKEEIGSTSSKSGPCCIIMCCRKIFYCKNGKNVSIRTSGKFVNSIRRKAIGLVLAIIFLFLLQWSPFWIFQTFVLFSTTSYENIQILNMIVSTLSYSNTVTNPALYMLFTYNFKEYLHKGLMKSCLRKSGNSKRKTLEPNSPIY
ncbi:D(2) dopamine receptor isoform X2 [Brachionus plicatilis]|uniref:D(2) dopamine receptor isoform X2 n=1 Tax=Brachionus plicatilis TaxID=10195 RepID=A0A3M7S096_BRAPC|nr:D(2) dopamine receptor isoform X2 [Brachionus plicatilis]